MAKTCKECNKKLPLFSSSFLCKECIRLINEKYAEIKNEVLKNFDINEEQADYLRDKFRKDDLLNFYNEIYKILVSAKGLMANDYKILVPATGFKKNELEFLLKIKDGLKLSGKDIDFDEKIQPYIYINIIKEKNVLPDFEPGTFSLNLILKKNEKIFFADKAVLKEIRARSLGYCEGRSGVSFRIISGVDYVSGEHKGNIANDDILIQTSKGILIITSERLLLNPFPGNRPLSIPLDKILSYQAYQNGIEVYKEDSRKGYFFKIDNIGSVEVFGICLSFLLSGAS
jgi:hypothetical protein